MGAYNKIDGVCEVPLPGDPCVPCEGTGKVTVAEGEETKEQPCGECGATGYQTIKTIKLRNRIRGKVKADYEDWLEYEARRRPFDFKDQFTAEELNKMHSTVAAEVGARTYRWGGRAWESSITQLPGIIKIIKLLADDADRYFRKDDQRYQGQHVTESQVMDMMRHPVSSHVLGEAYAGILRATPNFQEPPVRGIDD